MQVLLAENSDTINAINKRISEKVGPQKYRIWFKSSTRMSISGDYLKVGVPNVFIGSWIENHFINEINDSINEITGSQYRIAINIEPELSGRQRKTQLNQQANQVRKIQDRAVTHRVLKPSKPRTLSDLTLENFIVGSRNQLAFNAAKMVADSPQRLFNPLFIHGGYGQGKTHLLQGICNSAIAKNPEVKCIYVSAEDFTNQYVMALKSGKLDSFRKKFRSADILAIDDIHFLANKKSTQEEFLHTFNTIDLASKQVVLASDAHPKMIGQLTDNLVNRFVSGMVVKVDAPDFSTRLKICNQKASQMNWKIPDDVIEYVAAHIKANIREIEGALIKLCAYASVTEGKIDLFSAERVLSDHITKTAPIVHISDIESSVSTFFGITPADLHSSKKDRTVSTARAFSMYLARKYTKMSYPEIGKLMGGKNHATVILAYKRIEDLLNKEKDVKWQTMQGVRSEKAQLIVNQLKSSVACA